MATIKIVIDALENFVAENMKKIALDIVANLQAAPSEGGTPVKTGWARANWVPYIGAPRETPVGSKEEAKQGILPDDSERQKALIASSYRIQDGNISVVNNVPYIVRLNEGSSRQAPAGFVQAAIARATQR